MTHPYDNMESLLAEKPTSLWLMMRGRAGVLGAWDSGAPHGIKAEHDQK